MISIKSQGNFEKTIKYLKKLSKRDVIGILDKYGQRGVELLSSATPVNTGKTSQMWSYEINAKRGQYEINWINNNVVNGVNIAIIIQYGHGTRNGGYVRGIDYINPVIKQVFNDMAEELRREVSSE